MKLPEMCSRTVRRVYLDERKRVLFIEAQKKTNPARGNSFAYEARSALMILKREALTAGKNPPTSPMTSEKIIVNSAIIGVKWNPNASSVNDYGEMLRRLYRRFSPLSRKMCLILRTMCLFLSSA